MSLSKIVFSISLLFLFASCGSDEVPDFTFDIVGDFEGQMISSTEGLRFVSCSVTRVDDNEIRVAFSPSTAGAGFDATVTESANGYYFEVIQQPSTDSLKYVRGTDQFAESNDGELNVDSDIIQFSFEVSSQESFASRSVEEFTGARVVASTTN